MVQVEANAGIAIDCYSDVLCVWAYVAQIRLDELNERLSGQVCVHHHYINLFGSTAHRIGEGWSERGGFAAFSDHVVEVCAEFPYLEVNHEIWRSCRPLGSGNAHLMLKAVQVLEQAGRAPLGAAEAFAWQIRLAFFRDARDIGDWCVLLELAEANHLERETLELQFHNGTAMAALLRDQELRDRHDIAGSPTYVLNGGRQKLFGNVGYRVIEANVKELLEHPGDQASWC